jgi:hypothetical protein
MLFAKTTVGHGCRTCRFAPQFEKSKGAIAGRRAFIFLDASPRCIAPVLGPGGEQGASLYRHDGLQDGVV